MKKLLITEEDRKHILNLYGLINEQEVVIPPPMDVLINFQSGCHSNKGGNKCAANQVSNNIDPKIKEIEDFLRKAPKGKLIEVVLSSGESQVPNKDAEKVDLPRLKPGVLSQMRYTSLEQYLTTKFQTWISQGVISSMPRFTKIEPVIGPTAWDPKKGAQHPDYTKEQFMKVTLRVTNEPVTQTTTVTTTETTKVQPSPDCAVGLKIRVYVPRHTCQNAEFFILANNTLLYNSQGGMTANLNTANSKRGVPNAEERPKYSKKVLNPGYGYLPNGDGTLGSYSYGNFNDDGNIGKGRSDTFVVTEEQSRKIVSEGNGYINIWMIATTQTAHRDLPKVQITKIINGVNTTVYDGEPKVVQGKILTLDACGNKVVEADNGQAAPPVTSYLNALLTQKRSIMKGFSPNEVESEQDDYKAPWLEKSSGLIKDGEILMNKILPLSSTSTGKTEAVKIIKSYYTPFYTKINAEPNYSRDQRGNYINPTLNSDMYKDVKMDLDLFYEIFDAIYKQQEKDVRNGIAKGEINPKGRSLPNGTIDLTGIKQDLGKIKKEKMTKV